MASVTPSFEKKDRESTNPAQAASLRFIPAHDLTPQTDAPLQISDGALHNRIASLAYQHWLERGCPFGSPEVDWDRATQEISSEN